MRPAKALNLKMVIVGGTIPREFIPAVRNGIEGAMNSGVRAGYPCVISR